MKLKMETSCSLYTTCFMFCPSVSLFVFEVQWDDGCSSASGCISFGVFLVDGDILLHIIRGAQHYRNPLVD